MPDKQVTQSVLDQMTGGIAGRKSDKATQLTPVGMERKPVLPNDLPGQFMSSEALADAAKDLRVKSRLLYDIANSIDTLVGQVFGHTEEPEPEVAVDTKAVEQAADAAHRARQEPEQDPGQDGSDFATTFARKSAAAQAAAFAQADEPVETEPVETAWACPEHGFDNIRILTSRKGRSYPACSCGEFQK